MLMPLNDTLHLNEITKWAMFPQCVKDKRNMIFHKFQPSPAIPAQDGPHKMIEHWNQSVLPCQPFKIPWHSQKGAFPRSFWPFQMAGVVILRSLEWPRRMDLEPAKNLTNERIASDMANYFFELRVDWLRALNLVSKLDISSWFARKRHQNLCNLQCPAWLQKYIWNSSICRAPVENGDRKGDSRIDHWRDQGIRH